MTSTFFGDLRTLKIYPAPIMHNDGDENKNAIRGYQTYFPVSCKKCACGTPEHPLAFEKHSVTSLWLLSTVHNNWRL